jgi:hypothetical protein
LTWQQWNGLWCRPTTRQQWHEMWCKMAHCPATMAWHVMWMAHYQATMTWHVMWMANYQATMRWHVMHCGQLPEDVERYLWRNG